MFLPLFATSYFLYGMVLTKVRGIGAHRRLGAVEIPVMVKEVPKEMGEEGDHNPWLSRSQLGAWVREQSTAQSNPVNKFWSMTAVDLVRYLLKPQCVRRVIDIY